MNRKTGVILSFISIIFEVFSTLILTPYLIKTLGESEFGVYKMCLSIIAYVLLLDLGIGNAIIRFASAYRFNNDKNAENNLAGISLVFYVSISFLSLIIGTVLMSAFPYLFSKGFSESEIVLGKKLIFITSITASITLATSGFYNMIIAHEKFFVSKGVGSIQTVFKIILSIIVLKLGGGSIGVCFVNLLLTALTRFFYVFYAVRFLNIKPRFKKGNKNFVKEVMGYSALVAVQMIATQMNQSLDQILIGGLVENSSSILGIYAVGSQLNQYFMSIGVAITGVLMPGIVRVVEGGASREQLTKEVSRLSRLIFFPLIIAYCGFLVFGKPFITIWTSDYYIDAYYVAVILITPQLLVSVLSPCCQVLWAKNRQKELTWTKLGIVIANCFLTIALIGWNPLIGASLGTLLSVMFGDVFVLLGLIKSKINISLSQYLLDVFPLPSIMMFAISCVFYRTSITVFPIKGWLSLFAFCFSFLIVSLFLNYCFCLNIEEKNMISKMLRKFKGLKNGKRES